MLERRKKRTMEKNYSDFSDSIHGQQKLYAAYCTMAKRKDKKKQLQLTY